MVRRVLLALGAALALSPEPAWALEFDYRAPEECPSADEFREATLSRLTTPGVAEKLWRVAATVSQQGDLFVAEVQIQEPGGAPLTRSLSAHDCPQVVDALALATALALDSASHPPPQEPTPEPEPPTAARPEPQGEVALPFTDASAEAEKAPAAAPLPVSFLAGAALTLRTGIAPIGAIGQALELGAAVGPWRAELYGEVVFETGRQRDQAQARFSALIAGGRLCAGGALGSRWWLGGCGSFEGGRLVVKGVAGGAVRSADRVSVPWVLVGVGGQLSAALGAGISLGVHLTGGMPVDRPRIFRFRNADAPFFEVPAFALNAGLCARYTF